MCAKKKKLRDAKLWLMRCKMHFLRALGFLFTIYLLLFFVLFFICQFLFIWNKCVLENDFWCFCISFEKGRKWFFSFTVSWQEVFLIIAFLLYFEIKWDWISEQSLLGIWWNYCGDKPTFLVTVNWGFHTSAWHGKKKAKLKETLFRKFAKIKFLIEYF